MTVEGYVTTHDGHYHVSSWLSWAQGISALIFISQFVLGLCQVMDVSYLTRNLWAISVTYTALHAVVTFAVQTGAFMNYQWKVAGRMSSIHNSDVNIAFFASLSSFVLIMAFQFNWLATYTPTWISDAIEISSANAGEVRTYFSLQAITILFSLVGALALIRAVGAHFSPLTKFRVTTTTKERK